MISVIIPCFNYGCYVIEAIESALAQTIENLEIIVVEGGSTDTSTRVVLEQLSLPRTRVIYKQSPTLVGENRNSGIREARGRYICCLDADDILLPTYLEKAIYLLETYGYDIVSTQYESFGADEAIYAIHPSPTLAEMIQGNNVMTCAVFRRADWERTPAGFVDTGKGAMHLAEDWRFWVELALQGARIRNITNECLLKYRVYTGKSSLSTSEGVPSPALQKKMILELFNKQLNSAALQNSQRMARKRYRCEVLGGVLPFSIPSKTKPTLLVCSGLIINGGAERITSALVGHLVSHGWRVIVVSTVDDLTENSEPVSWFSQYTTEVYQLQRFLISDKERSDFLKYLVASRNVDIVLQVGSVLLYGILHELREIHAGCKIIDLLFNISKDGHIESNRKYKNFIDHIITENSEVKSYLLECGESFSRVSQILSGVDIVDLHIDIDHASLRNILMIPNDAIVFGFSGRWSPEKNPMAFLEIARRCSDLQQVYFVMTGGGPMSDVVRTTIQAERLDRVRLCGFVDELASYLAMYDVLVLPSKEDGRPVVVMEAMALGTPCLASRVGGVPEMIQDGITGQLINPNDMDSFESAVRSMVSNPSSIRCMGIAAQNFALNCFDRNKMLKEYENVLKSLIRDKAA